MTVPGPDCELTAAVLLGAWCSGIWSVLTEEGVSDVVISPGSRNTPLTLLALSETGLTSHSVIDERSAGFFALGLARASRKSVALLCTSGTALAHYAPALIEASYDGLPLVVVSADRPPELQGCGAPQTIDQQHVYGNFLRGTYSVPVPTDSEEAFSDLGEALRHLVQLSCGQRPGPVHLNVPLRKPLEPLHPTTPSERTRVARLLARLNRAPGGKAPPRRETPSVAALLKARSASKRPLLVAGPLPPADLPALEKIRRALGMPLLQEFGPADSSGLEFATAQLIGDDAPDLLVHVGPPAVSSRWERYVEQFEGRYFVLSGSEFRDPSRRAEAVLVGHLDDAAATIDATADFRDTTLHSPPSPSMKIQSTVRRLLETADATTRYQEPLALRELLAACPKGTDLILGNSLSLRLASWVWPAAGSPAHPYTARGVNGIDGMFAWSAGLVQSTGRPTLSILGDVTAAHDIGSLQLLSRSRLPLVFAVVDNGGGRIFDHLPARKSIDNEKFSFWTTAPHFDLEAVASAFGLSCKRVSELSEIADSVQAGLKSRRPHLIIVPTQSETSFSFLEDVRAGLAE